MASNLHEEESQLMRIVSSWTNKYLFYINRADDNGSSSAFKYLISFNIPTPNKPVPQVEAHVWFKLEDNGSTVAYRYENEDSIFSIKSGAIPQYFEERINRLIEEKMYCRLQFDLTSSFEKSRLQETDKVDIVPFKKLKCQTSPLFISETRQPENASSMKWNAGSTMKQSEINGDKNDSVAEYLLRIFDAADEEQTGALSIFEIEELLQASTLSLSNWDLETLLYTMPLNGTLVYYAQWVMESPKHLEEIRKRRTAYEIRNKNQSVVSQESILQCFEKEFKETERILEGLFRLFDKEHTGKLSRSNFEFCLKSSTARLSTQEIKALLVRIHPMEDGSIAYGSLKSELARFRCDLYNNAIFETSSSDLRNLLESELKKEKLKEEAPVWQLRDILLNLSYLFPSRMQIHIILCVVDTNAFGMVKLNFFVEAVCKLLPEFFDSNNVTQAGKMIEEEKADAKRREDLADLKMKPYLSTQLNIHKQSSNNEQDEKLEAMRKKNVEKTLIHLFRLLDDEHSGSLDWNRLISAMNPSEANEKRHNDAIQDCKLTKAEVRGFIAEAVLSEFNRVRYVEHVKTWIPILFEMRKMHMFSKILSEAS